MLRPLRFGHFLTGPSPKLSLSGLTSETRAAPHGGAAREMEAHGLRVGAALLNPRGVTFDLAWGGA
jgi:hypothetical protein